MAVAGRYWEDTTEQTKKNSMRHKKIDAGDLDSSFLSAQCSQRLMSNMEKPTVRIRWAGVRGTERALTIWPGHVVIERSFLPVKQISNFFCHFGSKKS